MQSPQMIQAMKILQLGTLDLQERIDQELVENPMLEEISSSEDADASLQESPVGPAQEPSDPEQEGVQRMLDALESLQRDFGDGGRATGGDGEEGDRKLQALANTPSVPKTMAEALSEELAFIELSPRKRAIAEFLIFSMDERGYLPDELADLAEECPIVRTHEPQESGVEACKVEELAWVLGRLRALIHPALGARDLREALLLQVELLNGNHAILRKIISDHLEDVKNNRLPRIAKALGQPIETVLEVLEQLRRLDPAPAAEYGESVATIIVPDVLVEEDEGEYVVRLERARIPRLQLSPTYRKMLEDAKKGDGTRAWLKKRLESARWFIDAITQRQSTLERIANVIFERQKPFLERGKSELQPLRMQEVADTVEVHISTVSRAVNGKYAQTPRGIFPLKFFFSGGTSNETGEVSSQVSIQQHMKELVAQENKQKPLSDEEIVTALKSSANIQIARRTVSKYRKMLGIASSSQRRQFIAEH
ncbi:MAG: RNA polymerase sigma-54 factor [Candidatus Paceibacteria bacterium]|jgi:RNA polymerase sigma-54 factor